MVGERITELNTNIIYIYKIRSNLFKICLYLCTQSVHWFIFQSTTVVIFIYIIKYSSVTFSLTFTYVHLIFENCFKTFIEIHFYFMCNEV